MFPKIALKHYLTRLLLIMGDLKGKVMAELKELWVILSGIFFLGRALLVPNRKHTSQLWIIEELARKGLEDCGESLGIMDGDPGGSQGILGVLFKDPIFFFFFFAFLRP